MHFSINSKILGRQLTFSRPGDFYIYVDTNRKHGCLGEQICERGNLAWGNTLGYWGDDEERFKDICRRWYRSYTRDKKW